MVTGYRRVALDFIPSHEAGVPLQAPSEVHFRILDPLRMKPSSHSKYTLWGYNVRLPKIVPFDGASIGPQSLAKKRWQNFQIHTKKQHFGRKNQTRGLKDT